MFEIHVETRGPLFDGRAIKALHDYEEAAVEEVARVAKTEVLSRLDAVLQHQTPHYATRIRRERVGAFTQRVDDDRVIYGNWLEGTGSRNFPRTRFRGYATFRRVGQQVDREAGRIAERVLDRYIERMN